MPVTQGLMVQYTRTNMLTYGSSLPDCLIFGEKLESDCHEIAHFKPRRWLRSCKALLTSHPRSDQATLWNLSNAGQGKSVRVCVVICVSGVSSSHADGVPSAEMQHERKRHKKRTFRGRTRTSAPIINEAIGLGGISRRKPLRYDR